MQEIIKVEIKILLLNNTLADKAFFFSDFTLRGGGRGQKVLERLRRLRSMCKGCDLAFRGSPKEMSADKICEGLCSTVVHMTYPVGRNRFDEMKALAPRGTFTRKSSLAACITEGK